MTFYIALVRRLTSYNLKLCLHIVRFLLKIVFFSLEHYIRINRIIPISRHCIIAYYFADFFIASAARSPPRLIKRTKNKKCLIADSALHSDFRYNSGRLDPTWCR